MNSEFENRVGCINREALSVFLRSLREPCYESQLFKIAFPEFEIFRATPIDLFQHHFLLFHVLYQLQEVFYREDRYLFIHFMRTMLLSYPEAGRCRYFHEGLVSFCGAACPERSSYCEYHAALVGDAALEELSLKYFYADSRNFSTLDEETAEAFLNGAWQILTHYDAYQQAFRTLGISETSDMAMIKKTFKRLAKACHPDFGQESHEQFVEINNAYQFLLRVIPGLKAK